MTDTKASFVLSIFLQNYREKPVILLLTNKYFSIISVLH